MKKNKGFTLIELLVTIAILAVILIISVPSIMGVLEKSKKQAFVESGISIVKSFTKNNSISDLLEENNIELPSNGSSKSINLKDINYENGNEITGDIVITNQDGKYSYYLYITDGEYVICNKEYSKTTHKDVEKGTTCGEELLYPTIENKYESQTYSINSQITESMILTGVTARDTRDGDITDKITYVSNIDTTKVGEYEITYTVENSLGNTATTTRKIIIRPKAYYANDEVTLLDGSKWYVLYNSGSDSNTVTLFASKNISSGGSSWTDNQYSYGKAFDENGSNSYSSSTIKTFLEGSVTTYINKSLTNVGGIAIDSIRLISKSEYEKIKTNAWSCSTNYWTSDYSGFDDMYFIRSDGWMTDKNDSSLHAGIHVCDGQTVVANAFKVNHVFGEKSKSTKHLYNRLDGTNLTAYIGARPVIVTLKSNIK